MAEGRPAVEDFDQFVTARGAALLRFAYVLSRDHSEAQDLVQEALAKSYFRWRKVTQPDAYVRRAIVNTYLSWRRRPNPTPSSSMAEYVANDPLKDVLDRDQLRQLLNKLSRRQAAVLVLRYYEDISDAEIADILGCRQTTVRSLAARAVATLRLSESPDPVVDQRRRLET